MSTPLELTQSYMDMVYGGRDLEELRPLLGERFSFRGPFLPCDSADQLICGLLPVEFVKYLRNRNDDFRNIELNRIPNNHIIYSKISVN